MRSPDQLYGREPGDETLARCRADKWPAGKTPWDGARPGEEGRRVKQRHKWAAESCEDCVVLQACEMALSAMEKESLHVEGVMAGRYSDVRNPLVRKEEFRQTACRFCKTVMKPQGDPAWWNRSAAKRAGNFRQHVGEGLCSECFPTRSRKARGKYRENQGRHHMPHHPFPLGWEAIA